MFHLSRSLSEELLVSLFLQYFSKCQAFGYPIISDPARETAIKLGMLDPEEKDKAGLPLTCRAVSDLCSNISLERDFKKVTPWFL